MNKEYALKTDCLHYFLCSDEQILVKKKKKSKLRKEDCALDHYLRECSSSQQKNMATGEKVLLTLQLQSGEE